MNSRHKETCDPPADKEAFDVIVIGGGLTGCFALRALMGLNVKAALFECREDLCTGISRANTAIVYSGCDTKPGTLKTEMCVRSARGFAGLCEELGVRYSRCGSVMVSFGPRGDGILRRKYEQGITNGVRELRLLDKKEAIALEPGLAGDVTLGLYIPDTGTVNPWELCLAAAENAVCNGARLCLNTKVTGISKTSGGYTIETPGAAIFTRGIINCAGLNADKIYETTAEPKVRIVPTAGDYLVLDTKASGAVRHIIFHEPEKRGKGVTIVPTVDGNVLVGPTETERSPGGGFESSGDGEALLRSLAAKVIPKLPPEHIIRNFGALRPNPFRVARDQNGEYAVTDESISDFCIMAPEESPGFISLVGIKTPGLTCAEELGRHVAGMIEEIYGFGENKDFDPRRVMPVRPGEMCFEARAALIEENPEYGRIVCRCREISEAEIKNAIRIRPGAVTADGVKRRTGATSGRCQGGYCTQKIIEIIADETGRRPEDIQKDGPGSYIVLGGKNAGI